MKEDIGQVQSTKNESFIRWQGRSLEALGNTINLLLSLCLATIAFVVSKFLDSDYQCQNPDWISITIAIGGIIFLLVSTALLLWIIYNRLISFRKTTQIARKREKNNSTGIEILRQEVQVQDKCTWQLLKFAIISFVLGEAFIIIAFIIKIAKRT